MADEMVKVDNPDGGFTETTTSPTGAQTVVTFIPAPPTPPAAPTTPPAAPTTPPAAPTPPPPPPAPVLPPDGLPAGG